MGGIKKFFLQLHLYSKRLYKKAAFIVMLVVLALTVTVASFALRKDSSMVRVAVVGSENSSIASQVVNKLQSSKGVVSYSLLNKDEAVNLLKKGECDAVWVFCDGFDEEINLFATGKSNEAPIDVTVRERDIFTNLVLERLFAELFPVLSKEFYFDYARQTLGYYDRQGLIDGYDTVALNTGIVRFSYYNDTSGIDESDFLVAPLRGIMAVLLSLCTLTAVLWFLKDRDDGKLDATPMHKRGAKAYLYCFSAAFNFSVFILLSIALSGLFTNLFSEIAAIILFLFATVGFSLAVGAIFKKTVVLAAAMPVIMLAMLALCPVFLNMEIPFVSCIFPTYWYLNAIYSSYFLIRFVIYTVLVNAAAFLLLRFRRKTF